jgi:polyhydroxyalkanoate synthesis regulator phasin
MPKKQTKDDPKAQSERFEKAVQELVDAGELDPIEAGEAFERALKRAVQSGAPQPEQTLGPPD